MANAMSVARPPRPSAIPNTAPAPPVPTTLHETGLSADQIEQLLVKTLYGGEATGLTLAERMRLPFTMLEPLIEHAARRAAHRGARHDRLGLGQLPLRADRRRARSRARSISTPTSTSAPRRCRSPPTSRRCARCRRRAATSIASGCARASRTSSSATTCSSSSARGQRRQGGVSLRPSRQRQDRDRRRAGPRARRRHVHAARDRRRRPHHHDVRSDQPRLARGRRRVVERHRGRRRAIAAGCASGGPSSWSAAS